jgi:DnaD/phage-associated family protein
MTAFLDKINPTPSPICLEELKTFAEQMGSECCIRAMDIALDAKKANWNYIRAILRSKLQQGVKSIADWDRLEESREGAQYFAKPRATTSADIARMIEAGEFDD